VIGSILLLVVIILFGALGIHHFIKARRGLRTGNVEGLMIGYSGKRYSRENDPEAFWTNIRAGFVAAGCGGILVVWAILVTLMAIGDRYFGWKPL
jgi:hypothetical protein